VSGGGSIGRGERVIVASPSRGVEPRRWICAAGIGRGLPEDRFAARPFDARSAMPAGSTAGSLLLADSDDRETCSRFPEWKGLGGATAAVVTDPTRPLRIPPGCVDAFLVEGAWSADFLRRAYGIAAKVIPPGSIRPRPQPPARAAGRFVTFIDPIAANGVDLFARMADELGRRRPDIPLLVVEGVGLEADLMARGLDLRASGNLSVMSAPRAAAEIWEASRFLVAPCLDPWAGAILHDAARAGVPIIHADHPLLRELLEGETAALDAPTWMTPGSLGLASPAEADPWVERVIRWWDEGVGPREPRRDGPDARRVGEVIASILRLPAAPVRVEIPAEREGWAVLVPFLNHIEPECEAALHGLEMMGVRVVRCRGCSAIDHARCLLASEAVRRGSRSVLFVDSDVAFDPSDALRLLARPEPVVAGIYVKKNAPALSSVFRAEDPSITFGEASPGDYPLKYAAAGFLRIHTPVFRRMVDELALPLCDGRTDRAFWPFFLPLVVKGHDGDHHYLAEDWAFSHRLGQIGITPRADTTIRLFHVGLRGFTWEDTAISPSMHDSFTFEFSGG